MVGLSARLRGIQTREYQKPTQNTFETQRNRGKGGNRNRENCSWTRGQSKAEDRRAIPNDSTLRFPPLPSFPPCCKGLVFLSSSPYIASMPSISKKLKSVVRVISSKTSFRGQVFKVMTDEVEEPGNIRVRRD